MNFLLILFASYFVHANIIHTLTFFVNGFFKIYVKKILDKNCFIEDCLDLDTTWYANHDYLDLYIAEIEKILVVLCKFMF